MAETGAHDAKTHLPKLLERVEKRERIVVLCRGEASVDGSGYQVSR